MYWAQQSARSSRRHAERQSNRNGLLSLMAPSLDAFSERLCAPGEPTGDHRARGSCYPR
jgi:hypothetical protein